MAGRINTHYQKMSFMYDGMNQYKEQTSGETTLDNCITYTNRHVHHTNTKL